MKRPQMHITVSQSFCAFAYSDVTLFMSNQTLSQTSITLFGRFFIMDLDLSISAKEILALCIQ